MNIEIPNGSVSDDNDKEKSEREKILSLIRKAEDKRLAKRKIIQFLKRKGVTEAKLIEAYQQYYVDEKMYEITFTERPLGFSVIVDTRGKNAIVSSIQNPENIKMGMKIASRMYEVNGQRVDGLKNREILKIVDSFKCPFYIVFKEPKDDKQHKKAHETTWVESTEDSDCEESESENSSYSSDDDVRHVEQYNKRKQQDPQNKKKRVSKSASKSKSTSKGIFKFNEIDMWDQGDLDTEKNEMFKELAKLMVTAAASHVEPTTDSTLQAMSHTRKATLSKLVDKTPTARDNKMMTFDVGELSKGDDEHGTSYDPEILRYLQDLMGSEDKSLSRSVSSTANHVWHHDDLTHEDYNHLSVHPSSLDNARGLHADLTSKDNGDVLSQMKEGTTLLKYGKFGSGGYRTFRLSKDHKYLVWFSQKKDEADTKIPIKAIVEIRIGKESDVVRRVKDQDIYETSFTVIYGSDRNQLNVTAKSPQEAYVWAQGLKILSDASKRGADISTFKSLDVQNNDPSTHERANSVLISMDHIKHPSGINVFNKNNDTVTLEILAKRHTQLKSQLQKCVDFVMSKSNYKTIKSKGEFENVKGKLEKIDTCLRNIKEVMYVENNAKDFSQCKADLFSVAADLDALKQMLTVLVRQQKEL